MKKKAGLLVTSARMCGVLLLLLLMTVPDLHAQRRKRIAVLSFEVGAGAVQTAQGLGVRDDMGLILSNLLVNELAGAGKVQIVERSALDKVLKEENLSNSDRLDNTTAAKIGKIAGVDAILIGSVAQFVGTSDETGGSKVSKIFLGKSGVSRVQTQVSIAVTSRLIDVSTGVVLMTAQGTGESKNLTMKVDLASSSQFGNAVLNDATMKAIKMMAGSLDASPVLTDMVAVARTAYKGVVADVSGNTLILSVGSKGGAKVGDVVDISKTGRVIKDPKTGAVLRTMYEHLGSAQITEVDSDSATAAYTGDKPPKVADVASFAP